MIRQVQWLPFMTPRDHARCAISLREIRDRQSQDVPGDKFRRIESWATPWCQRMVAVHRLDRLPGQDREIVHRPKLAVRIQLRLHDLENGGMQDKFFKNPVSSHHSHRAQGVDAVVMRLMVKHE